MEQNCYSHHQQFQLCTHSQRVSQIQESIATLAGEIESERSVCLNTLEKRINELEEQFKTMDGKMSNNFIDIRLSVSQLCQNNENKYLQIQIMEQTNTSQEKIIVHLMDEIKSQDNRIRELETFFTSLNLQDEDNKETLAYMLAKTMAEKELIEKTLTQQLKLINEKADFRKSKLRNIQSENSELHKQIENLKNQMTIEKQQASNTKEQLEKEMLEEKQQSSTLIFKLQQQLDSLKRKSCRKYDQLSSEFQKEKDQFDIQKKQFHLELKNIKNESDQKISTITDKLFQKEQKISSNRDNFQKELDELKLQLSQAKKQLTETEQQLKAEKDQHD